MPQIPIIMPQLGESIAEATVISLLVKVGDTVKADQDVMEVETNKATMNVASPCPGKVQKLSVKLHESYAVGATLGYLEVSEEDAERLGLSTPAPAVSAEDPATEANGEPQTSSIASKSSGGTWQRISASHNSTRTISPPCFSRFLRRAFSTRIRRIASEAAAKKCPRPSHCCAVV